MTALPEAMAAFDFFPPAAKGQITAAFLTGIIS